MCINRLIGFIAIYMVSIGCVAAICTAQTAHSQQPQPQPQEKEKGKGQGRQVVIGEDTAMSLGAVVVLIGIVGAWWTLRQSIAEQKIRLDLHVANVDQHHTVEKLSGMFIDRREYVVAHQEVLNGIARIERSLCDIQKQV